MLRLTAMHAGRIWGAVLVLCAAALLQTSASSSSSQRPQSRTVRITVADLPPSATAIPALNVTSAPPSCRHGVCTGATQPSEAPREASFATRVSDVPSSGARNHVTSSGDASAKKRVHADRVPHHSATTTHESHEDSFYKDTTYEHQDGDAATSADFATIDADAVAGGQQQRRAYKYEDHASAAERYDASLTTPRIELFDRRHARVSQGIRQNLQELEESNAATMAAPPLQPTEVPTRKPLRAPAPQPFRRSGHLPTTAPGDDANVALEYTNHVSVLYNLTADPPRSANGELVLENGTHVDFTSSYVHSEIFPDDVTTQASVHRQWAKNATVASTTSNSSEDQSSGSSRIVDNVKSASSVHSAKDEDNIVVNNTSILSSNKTQPIRVTPGDNPSTTSRSTSRSQETIEVAPTTAPIPNEVLTTTAPTKSHRARFPPKRLKQGPSTTASPVTTETPPTDAVRPRTRARMIASPRAPANASNSVEDAPSPSMAAIAAAAAAARKTTRYSWRRPSPLATIVTTTGAPDKEEATNDDMVRVVVPTNSPNASESASRRLTQAGRRATAAAAAAATRRGNVPADATPTPSAAVVRKFLSLRRRLPTTTTTTTSTTAPTLTPAPEASTRRPSTTLRRPSLATLQSRRRGSTRFGATDEDDDGGMAVPPTAAAWLLATLHGPAQSVPMPAAPAETTTTDSQPEEVIGVTTYGADTEGHLSAPATPTPATSEGLNEVTDGVATPTAPTPSPTPTPVSADTSAARRPPPSVHTTPAVTTTDAVQETSTSPVGNSTTTITPPSTVQSVGDDATTTDVNTTPGPSSSSAATQPAPFNAPAASSLDVEFVPLASTQTSAPEDDGTTTVAPVPIPIARTRYVNGTVQSSPSSLPPPAATAPATTTEGAGAATAASAPARSPASTTPLGPEAASETTVPTEAAGEGTTVDDVTTTERVTTDQPTTVGVTEAVGIEGAAGDVGGGGAETPTPLPEDTATTATTLPAPADAEPTSVGEQMATDATVNTFLRITVQASWEALCRDREIFRTALAHMAAERFGRNVSVVVAGMGSGAGAAECERMHVDSTGETRLLPVTVYLLDERGRFDKQLVESFYMVVSQQQQPSPLQITRVDLMYGPLPTTSSDSNAGVIAAITISCVGAICLLLLAALLIIMRKRQKRFNYGQRCTPVSLDAYSLDSVSVYNSVRRKGALRASKRSYGNPAFDDPGAPSHPMNFAGLANFSSDRAALEEEFEIIPQITPKSDELPAGAETKNRYSNVIPLPETRVQLPPIEGEPLSDYINANYVKGPKNESKFYIACQAPLPSTVTDFWRMIWEHQTKAILMLTDLVENGVEKCADYLPPSEVLDCHRLFGDFQITLKKREERDKYIISTLQLKNLETNSWREVMHLWYLNWPHQGVPEEANSLIAFLIEARPYMRSNTGPTVVHCSPGTGRTGTVLACDICVRDFEQTRMVDIPRCVYQLRRDRAGAVKTKDQYVFIYQVLNTYATKLTGGGGSLDSI